MVECKYTLNVIIIANDIVLIDTWWNVNVFGCSSAVPCGVVLIDTWWNVNHIKSHAYPSVFCFNRYMVECKFILSKRL